MSYPLPKDPLLASYLDQIRRLNKEKISICHYCKKQSTGINAIDHRIVFVCNEHYENRVGYMPNEYLAQDDYKDNRSRVTGFFGPNR